jgi:hypothetical protein
MLIEEIAVVKARELWLVEPYFTISALCRRQSNPKTSLANF